MIKTVIFVEEEKRKLEQSLVPLYLIRFKKLNFTLMKCVFIGAMNLKSTQIGG